MYDCFCPAIRAAIHRFLWIMCIQVCLNFFVNRWRYAYNSVLEETVRRRRKMWSWKHISEHRMTMRRYREAYTKKLDSKKISTDVQKTITVCLLFSFVHCVCPKNISIDTQNPSRNAENNRCMFLVLFAKILCIECVPRTFLLTCKFLSETQKIIDVRLLFSLPRFFALGVCQEHYFCYMQILSRK